MRKTKIVCTIGPSTRSKKKIDELVKSGMNVARLNFSHDTREAHKKSIERIRDVAKNNNQPVAILQDLAGPKIRIGDFAEEPVNIRPGQKFILTNRDIMGDDQQVGLNYDKLPEDVKSGDTLLLADGVLEMEVMKTDSTDIECKVIVGGELSSRKGINLPDTVISTKTLTEKDKKDLAFGLENDVDYVALSFVRSAADVQEVKDIISKSNTKAGVIAKIEKNEALREIDKILEVVDGIMIARGDLGVEIPIEEVPVIQKDLIEKAKAKGKIVITATQMLKSMVESPHPTRAEVTDVANAIFDGTDAVMLSEETAVGKYPAKTVEMMGKIAKITENDFHNEAWNAHFTDKNLSIVESIANSACDMANQINAKGIVSFTHTGATTMLISKYKPSQKIIALTSNLKTYNKLALVWGAFPIHMKQKETVKKLDQQATVSVVEKGLCQPGELIVITAGIPLYKSGTTNLIKVATTGSES
jgi:pyruvate kinase